MFKIQFLLLLVLLNAGFVFGQTDKEGCQDHPMFKNRMPNYYIESCEFAEFSELEMYDQKKQLMTVGGRKWIFAYRRLPNGKGGSEVEIQKNYTGAIKSKGGIITFAENGTGHAYLKTGGIEYYMIISGWSGEGEISNSDLYILTIVEKGSLNQVIQMNDIKNDINTNGKSVLYIQFDSGKSTIKQESMPMLEQMAKLLNENKSLKVFIVGHTDNTGTFDANQKLSEERAAEVIKQLTGTYGVNPTQLSPKGVSSLCPVSTNDTEDGRKLNRRVEMVKM